MSRLSRVASALSFAHLTSFSSKGKRAEDDEDDKKGKRADDDMDDDDQDDQGKRSRRAESDDDEGDEDDKKGKRSKRAEADPDDEDEDGDDESEGDDDKGKRGRRAKRAEDDEPEDDPDADDDEDDKKSRKGASFRKGQRAERTRWARVLQSKAATGRVAMAAHLLSASSMSSSQIIDVLRDSPRQDGAAAERSRRNPDLGASGAPNVSRATAIQASWDRALKRASGG